MSWFLYQIFTNELFILIISNKLLLLRDSVLIVNYENHIKPGYWSLSMEEISPTIPPSTLYTTLYLLNTLTNYLYSPHYSYYLFATNVISLHIYLNTPFPKLYSSYSPYSISLSSHSFTLLTLSFTHLTFFHSPHTLFHSPRFLSLYFTPRTLFHSPHTIFHSPDSISISSLLTLSFTLLTLFFTLLTLFFTLLTLSFTLLTLFHSPHSISLTLLYFTHLTLFHSSHSLYTLLTHSSTLIPLPHLTLSLSLYDVSVPRTSSASCLEVTVP